LQLRSALPVQAVLCCGKQVACSGWVKNLFERGENSVIVELLISKLKSFTTAHKKTCLLKRPEKIRVVFKKDRNLQKMD